MKKRTFTASEERGLGIAQKAYLQAHPQVVSLQPQELASEALYKTFRHGAVTIARAIELDACHDHQIGIAVPSRLTVQDSYSNEEDSFIDLNGMSSGLH